MPISANFTSIYTKEWEINFIQCYPNGHLKYTELCTIFQLTAALHAEKGGLSFTDMQVFDQAWVLSLMRVEVDQLPKWGDVVTVKTWIIEMSGFRSIRALELFVGNKKLAGALTNWVVLNTKLRKPESLALPFNHFEMHPEMQPTVKQVEKIAITEAVKILKTNAVVLSDLDIVNHANNVKYLEWCLDSISPDLILSQKIKALDMNFLRELHLHDVIEISAALEEIPLVISVSKKGKNSFALQIEI